MKRKFHAGDYVECPVCNGTGTVTVEDHVVSWTHGGYIQDRIVECLECGGSGLVDRLYED
jgi:DnaJ-class molecular chaperone